MTELSLEQKVRLLTGADFWSLHAAIGATGGLLMLLFRRSLARVLEPQPNR